MMPDGSASSQKLSDLPIFESNFAPSRLRVQMFNLTPTVKTFLNLFSKLSICIIYIIFINLRQNHETIKIIKDEKNN